MTDIREDRKDINGAYALIGNSTVRNDMILEDTRACVKAGRTPVILTRYKEQAKYLYEKETITGEEFMGVLGGVK